MDQEEKSLRATCIAASLILFFILMPNHAKADFATSKTKVESVDTQAAQAACGQVNVASTLGPVRNQRSKDGTDLNNCYAQVAADLLTQYIRQRDPILAKDQFRTAASQLTNAYQAPLDDKGDNSPLRMPLDQYPDVQPRGGKGSVWDGIGNVDDALIRMRDRMMVSKEKICSENSSLGTPEGPSSDFYLDIQKHTNLSTKKINQYVQQVIQKECQIFSNPNFFVHSYEWDTKNIENKDRNKINTINQALGQNRAVGIGLNVNFLQPPPPPSEPIKHSMTLVARVWHNGQCLYALRDSMGGRCNYAQPFQAQCLKNPGYIWVTEEQLQKNAFGVTYIPNQNLDDRIQQQRQTKSKSTPAAQPAAGTR